MRWFLIYCLLKLKSIAKLNVYSVLYRIVNEKNTRYASTAKEFHFTGGTRDEYYMSVKALVVGTTQEEPVYTLA